MACNQETPPNPDRKPGEVKWTAMHSANIRLSMNTGDRMYGGNIDSVIDYVNDEHFIFAGVQPIQVNTWFVVGMDQAMGGFKKDVFLRY